MKKTKRIYNWQPDLKDQRDFLYSYKVVAPKKIPKKVDLSSQCSPVFNQGQIGSCTANALAGALEFLELKGSKPESFGRNFSSFSRLFIYFNERTLESTTSSDAGARLQDGVKSLNKWGSCRESLWKYQPSNVFKKPSAAAFKEAVKHTISQYLRLNSLIEIKQSLADGYPVAFGFTVYESFESLTVAKTGLMPLPKANEKVLGGHAVLAVGYDDTAKKLLVRNSWGAEWGLKGYFLMPYAYIESKGLAQDFWTLRE